MVMVPGTNEDRANAIHTAATFCAGSGVSPETLVFVADVALRFITQGSQAALTLAREGVPATDQQSASPAPPSSDGTGSEWRASTARELALEAYRATSRSVVEAVAAKAAELSLMDEDVEMEGAASNLRDYLQARWNGLKNPELGL